MNLDKSVSKGYRSGFISLIGRPNVGKSTLVNQLVGEEVAITSPVAQTTRNRLRAILTTPKAQLILVDTPGIHKPHHLLGERLVKSACSTIGEVDLILLMLEGNKPPGRGDAFIVNLLQEKNDIPVVVVLNKWDQVKLHQYEERENSYKNLCKTNKWPFFRCSAITGEGCPNLIEFLSEGLPLGPYLYPKDMVSDQPERVLLSEFIREQVLLHTREELPHSVAVNIDRVEDRINSKANGTKKTMTAILATVLVERKSQKGIIIGKGGKMLKIIGQGARMRMQKLLDGPVYLELFVKVVPNWRSKPARLSELGYKWD